MIFTDKRETRGFHVLEENRPYSWAIYQLQSLIWTLHPWMQLVFENCPSPSYSGNERCNKILLSFRVVHGSDRWDDPGGGCGAVPRRSVSHQQRVSLLCQIYHLRHPELGVGYRLHPHHATTTEGLQKRIVNIGAFLSFFGFPTVDIFSVMWLSNASRLETREYFR